jgi:hypothetical protein
MRFSLVAATFCMAVLLGQPMAQAGTVSHPPHPQHPAHPATPSEGTHGKPATTGSAAHTPSPVPRNPKLIAKLQLLLPSGLSVEQAAAGFKNQGQFIAAVHVSHNLGIPFADLKSKALSDGGSLGSAIHALKPSADADTETERANKQAKDDLDEQ